jgi:hypothetical protein
MMTKPAVLLLLVVTSLSVMSAVGSEAGAAKDLSLSPADRQHFIGSYSVSAGGAAGPQIRLRLFAEDEKLFGQIGGNAPTRMLYQGDNVFRPEAASAFVLTFVVEGDRATRLSIVSPEGTMEGRGIETEEQPAAAAVEDPSRSGTLYEELARMDGLMFDAAFVTCEARRVNALLRDDIEFYHDQTGLRSGPEVREDFERLAKNCPRAAGIARRVVVGTLQVFPLKDGYAIQMGEHRFVNDAARTSTAARFVHLWQKIDGTWRLARVLSFDHHPEASGVR